MTMLQGKIVKVRWIKNYAEARNHVAVGMVLEETGNYLKLRCQTFHYRKIESHQKTGISFGNIANRLIPWFRIEVIHELPDGTQWEAKPGFDKEGNLILSNAHKTLIAGPNDVTN